MIRAFQQAFAQLFDPAFRKTLTYAIAMYSAVFLVSGGMAVWGVIEVNEWLISVTGDGWLGTILSAVMWLLGLVAFVVLGVMLFRSTTTLLMGIFLDDVVDAVYAKHYPHLVLQPPPRLFKATQVALRFSLLSLALNAAAMPVYALGMFIPLSSLLAFYPLNGYLFAREFCELVVPRRVSAEQKEAFLQAHRPYLLRWGMLVTLMYSVPILNLVAPLVATASMVHVYESLRSKT